MSDEVTLLSRRGQNSLLITAIVEEIARIDGWNNLDECFAASAAIVDTYIAYANAALGAIGRFSENTDHRH